MADHLSTVGSTVESDEECSDEDDDLKNRMMMRGRMKDASQTRLPQMQDPHHPTRQLLRGGSRGLSSPLMEMKERGPRLRLGSTGLGSSGRVNFSGIGSNGQHLIGGIFMGGSGSLSRNRFVAGGNETGMPLIEVAFQVSGVVAVMKFG